MARTICEVHGGETVALATALEDHTTRGIPHQTIDSVTTGLATQRVLALPITAAMNACYGTEVPGQD